MKKKKKPNGFIEELLGGCMWVVVQAILVFLAMAILIAFLEMSGIDLGL